MVGTYQKVIDGKNHYYCEHHKPENTVFVSGVKAKSELQKLLPLLSIFGLIAVLVGITMFIQSDFSLMNVMMLSMAYFFLVFGAFKVINLHNFVDAYMTYDILAIKSKTYAYIYPFIEITLGVLYFFYIGGVYRDIFTFILMSIGTVGVWKALQNKDEIPCACLGMVFTVPMTKVTLFENLFMAVMALVMVLMYLAMGNMAM
jgi:hypothetical protein